MTTGIATMTEPAISAPQFVAIVACWPGRSPTGGGLASGRAERRSARRAAVAASAAVPLDPARALDASTSTAAMDGLQTQWLLDPDAVDLAEATAFAIEAVLAATLAGARRPRPLA